MLDTYNKVLKYILCKVAEVDENVHEKEIKKIEEIYFKLTGNHFSKLITPPLQPTSSSC